MNKLDLIFYTNCIILLALAVICIALFFIISYIAQEKKINRELDDILTVDSDKLARKMRNN